MTRNKIFPIDGGMHCKDFPKVLHVDMTAVDRMATTCTKDLLVIQSLNGKQEQSCLNLLVELSKLESSIQCHIIKNLGMRR